MPKKSRRFGRPTFHPMSKIHMAVAIGKRKREAVALKPRKARQFKEHEPTSQDDTERLKAIFQKHFEAQFKPLPVKKAEKPAVTVEQEEQEDDEQDDWEGFESDEDAQVQVVEYREAGEDEDVTLSKRESKAFMSGKVPKTSKIPMIFSNGGAKGQDDEDEDEAKMNLKNDLALQRLLKESHLLDSSKDSSLEASGKNRLRALDIRMQSLGAKGSTFDAGKRPMLLQKSINAASSGRNEKRRTDAKENGIILEKEKREKKFGGRRETGIGGPIMGKYKGGMLTLSKRDVRAIEGPKSRDGKGKRRGRK